jgi:hypothetical protein
MIWLGLLGLSISSCSGSNDPIIADESDDPWRMVNGYCVRQSSEGPVMRVTNRTDPELCGIKTKERPKEFVRVVPQK